MKKSILITGGNSFIGIHIVNELIKRNTIISVLVRSKKTIPEEWIGEVKVFEGNLANNNSISIIGNSFDTVFHLAAYVHKTPKTEAEKRYVHAVNVDGTVNLLTSLCDSIKHVVFFSSVSVYGDEGGNNLDETTITNPTTLYGKSKLEAENIIKSWGQEKHVKTTSFRLPLVYGPGNKGNIHKMIEAIDKGYFIMFGKGKNKRSMVYVGNVVDAAMAVVDQEEINSKVYIVTDGVDYTVRELYENIAKTLKKKPLKFYIPMIIARGLAWVGDIGGRLVRKPLPFNSEALKKLTDSLTLSSLKIQKELDFKPKYNFYNTIKETVRWYKSE